MDHDVWSLFWSFKAERKCVLMLNHKETWQGTDSHFLWPTSVTKLDIKAEIRCHHIFLILRSMNHNIWYIMICFGKGRNSSHISFFKNANSLKFCDILRSFLIVLDFLFLGIWWALLSVILVLKDVPFKYNASGNYICVKNPFMSVLHLQKSLL